ncbi:hypothetical protein BURMUCGD1_6288 [Burkholderia multivorans CGD1]|nr:hypothetical protein BURMUCGD1_6288 [Burkholderia multivorans CGD1]
MRPVRARSSVSLRGDRPRAASSWRSASIERRATFAHGDAATMRAACADRHAAQA